MHMPDAGPGVSPTDTRPTSAFSFPAGVPPIAIARGYALLFACAVFAQVPIRPVDYQVFGLDFRDFWTAAADVLGGRDPYERARFVTPPPSWLPFWPLAQLPQSKASVAFFFCNVAALTVGTAWIARAFGLGRAAVTALALFCALSPATTMLLDRGNLDGLVFLALCAFFASRADGWTGPLALATGAGLKIYPGLLILALLAHRRRRAALVAAGAVLAAVALTPAADLAFLHSQVMRAGGMRIDENLSALAVFWFVDQLAGTGVVLWAGIVLYAATLAACLRLDARLVGSLAPADRRLLLATYLGFCVSMPPLVYLYSGVCMTILVAALAQDGLQASPAALWRMAFAVAIASLPMRAFDLTLGTPWAGALNLVTPLGSALLIAAAVALRLDLSRRTRICPAMSS